MAVRFGHASGSEQGTINGAKGDSTKKEVCVRTWYNDNWDFMAIHPDESVRVKHAEAVEDACANDNIGYGQSDRNTLNTEAVKVNYDLSKIANKCNCDCSALQNVAAKASGAKGVTYASNGWTTSTMKSKLKAAGYIIIEDKTYLTSSTYCVKGAIYVRAGKHTVCGLDNGSKYKNTLEKAGLSGTTKTEQPEVKMESTTTAASMTCTTKLYQLEKGNKGKSVKALQILLIGYGYSCGKCGADGDFGSDTLKAVKAYQKAVGLDADGIVGAYTWTKLLGAK
jgi:hypothetical protein